MEFKGQYISIVGDSISTYEGYLPEDFPTFYSKRGAMLTGVLGYRDTWWGQVIELLGAHLLVNNSWSGSYVCKAKGCEIASYGCSDARTGGLDAHGVLPDHILIYIGTNDRGAGFRLYGDDKNDLSVIENAYGAMLDQIKKNYPHAEIWCCTFPITTCSRDRYFVFPRRYRGEPMENYGELIKRVAGKKKCRVIDLWDEEILCDTIDGLHPNYNGMCMIAEKVLSAMTGMKHSERKNT